MNSAGLYLSLGSNLGDRRKNIIDAIASLDNALGLKCHCSEIIETEPWGGAEGGEFLNCAIRYDIPQAGQNSELFCKSVLATAKSIETLLGRTGAPEFGEDGKRIYRARPIDIDIIFYGNNIVRTSELIIPHALAAERDFVMTPIRQIASDNLIASFPDIFHVK